MIEQLELRQVHLIGGSAAFLLLTAFAMLVGKPLYADYDKTQTEKSGLSMLATSAVSAGIKPLEDEVAALTGKLHGELQNLPVKQLEAHIIAALQSASWQYDVKLLTIEPDMDESDLPYQELSFKLELEGTYFSLDDWMRSVSSQLGYVVVKEYSLKVADAGVEPTLSARILLSAYRMQER